MIKGLTTFAISTLLLGGCVNRTHQATTPPALSRSIPIAPGDEKHPVIVHIVRHDRVITVKSGPDGLLYSMRGENDEVLLADATEAQFEQVNPQLFRELRHYMAVQADTSSSVER